MADIKTIKITLDASQAADAANRLDIRIEQVGEQADNANKKLGKLAGGIKAVGAGLAAVAAVGAAGIFATDQILKAISDYQDLADQTGATAAGIASMQQAADISGTSLDKVAGASVKLTQNLQKLGTEGNDTAEALKALGINTAEFQKLSPDEQLKKVAASMADFKDGAEKTAVAIGLFGKAGAELIPFLNDLAENQQSNINLTDEQIKAADEYAKAQARAMSDLSQLSKIAALQAAPAFQIFTNALTMTAKQMLGIDEQADALGDNKGIGDFAMGAVQVLGYVGDAAQFLARTLQSMGLSLGAAAAIAERAFHLDWTGIKAINKSANEDLKAIWAKPWMSDNVKKAIKDFNDAKNKVDDSPTKKLDYDSQRKEREKAARLEAEKAAKEHAAMLEKLDGQLDSLTGKYDPVTAKQRTFTEDMEKLTKIAALSTADLKKLGTTHEEVASLIEKAKQKHADEKTILQEESESIQRQIDLLGISKDARDAEAAAIALSTKLKAAGQDVSKEELATYKALVQELKNKQREETYNEAQKDRIQALQDEQALIGVVGTARDRAAKEQEVRRDAEKAQIDDVEAAVRKEMAAYDDLQESVKAYNSVMSNGAKEALTEYLKKAQDVAGATKDALTTVFGSLEDMFAKLFETGKLNFKDFVQSINVELRKIAARQISSSLVSGIAGLFGARAEGGSVMGGSSYLVGERGPEVFQPAVSGYIVPNNQLGGSSQTVVNSSPVNIDMTGMVITAGASLNKQALQSQIESAVYTIVTDELRDQGLFSR